MSNKKEMHVYTEVIRLDLHRIPEFDTLTPKEFCDIYNGYGPDSWPDWGRNLMTWIYRNFRPLAAVHDVAFAFSDGRLDGWQNTSKNWRRNISILLADKYPCRKFWLLPLRPIAWAKLIASHRVLKRLSYSFYIESKSR